jgi:hypothetical protein
MASQIDLTIANIPVPRRGDRIGNPYAAADEWIVCVQMSGHETYGIDHESVDGTRW